MHFNFDKTDFKCPHCNALHSDVNDKYLARCNKNKSGITKVKCSCGKSFFMTYNIEGEAVGFK